MLIINYKKSLLLFEKLRTSNNVLFFEMNIPYSDLISYFFSFNWIKVTLRLI